MHEQAPENSGQLEGSFNKPVETILGDDQSYDEIDPRTGLVRTFKNKGEYMREMEDRDNHNQ